jgi:endonuclease/exonuclease/phosphatase (EEP) superfamily protein YafD
MKINTNSTSRSFACAIWTAALLLIFSINLHAAGPGGGGGGGGVVTTLKVLTFNGWDHLSQGVAQVANDIKTTGADIVGLQECNGTDAAKLCSQLGTGWNFVQDYVAGDYTIISRYPILKRIGATDDPYGGIGATIELSPNQRVHFFNSHLNWTPYGPYQLVVDGMSTIQVISSENSVRVPGQNQVLNMAAPYVAIAEPTFYVGDFNAPSDLDYSPAVAWPTSVNPRNAGFTDSYFQLHPNNPKKWAGQFLINDPGITWSPHGDPYNCFDRIDFVYYSNGEATPTSSSEMTVATSDHRIVLTTFSIALPARTAKASNPIPANTGTGALRHPLLTWIGGSGATSYDVYLGTTSPGTFVGNFTDSKYLPAMLGRSTRYYWRVDTHTSSGIVTGDIWSFTTSSSGGVNPSKAIFAKNETITVNFDGGASNTDWIGLYKKGSGYGWDSASLSWKYLNNSQTAPKTAVSSGSITLTGQRSAGEYVIRFFKSDGYKLHDDVNVTVQ